MIVAATTALHAVAHEGFELDLDELLVVVAGGSSATTSMGDDRLSLDIEGSMGGSSSHDLVSRSSATPRTIHEYRLALWDSPMARLHYERAAAESMLGREGLVGGGRLLGLGAATTALGDGAPGGLRLLLAGETWKSLSLGEKAEVGLEASFVAALFYFMADSAH